MRCNAPCKNLAFAQNRQNERLLQGNDVLFGGGN